MIAAYWLVPIALVSIILGIGGAREEFQRGYREGWKRHAFHAASNLLYRATPELEPSGVAWERACAFADCPPGLFLHDGELGFKTGYSSRAGQEDAYCVATGEYFWGGASGDLERRNALIVQPFAFTEVALAVRPLEAEFAG